MKRIFICLLVAALGSVGFAWAGGGSAHGDKPHWGYVGEAGPDHWGELMPEFAACSEGRSQSPINVTGAVDANLPDIDFSYQASPVRLVNNGHTIKADYAPGSKINVDGKIYNLLQFHVHTLSENAINGKLFPMEAHLVHADAGGKLAVVGVMFEDGAASPFIENIWKRMPATANSTMSVSGQSINVMDMLPENKDYYSWTGSLTPPPLAPRASSACSYRSLSRFLQRRLKSLRWCLEARTTGRISLCTAARFKNKRNTKTSQLAYPAAFT